MKYHFIAIGGAAMHNLALALSENGMDVTGSDDQIFEPSRSRLKKAGLLPKKEGWFPEKITKDLDGVILGMHARKENPELEKAQELGIPVYSYPEFIANQSKDKKRVVIGGSHGKTSITAMVLHVLRLAKIDCDFMVGAQLDGFDTMVRLSESKLIILEGDEYLSSPIDLKPKFLWYKPHIAVLSGIAWDHINVFPTFENYLHQFMLFANSVKGKLFYFEDDDHLHDILETNKYRAEAITYGLPTYRIEKGKTTVFHRNSEFKLKIFGKHNLANMEAARKVCEALGVNSKDFYLYMTFFQGASKRLERIVDYPNFTAFKDFAHSPSKVKATVGAVKDQFKDWEVIALLELHTFSSLNADFLDEYNGAMNAADHAYVYYNPETIKHKNLPEISPNDVKRAFKREDVQVFTNADDALKAVKAHGSSDKAVLFMSSGNFDGKDVDQLLKDLAHKN